ncbi:MAG: glycoside hydrolase domain-containing protein [Terracidiphilus sp.]|jgi:hypothetical protein
MTLPGNIQAAPNGALGFDADTPISSAVAQQFVIQGYGFCVRYLSLGQGQGYGDLSAAEAGAILGSGLGLMAVQHVREPGWLPTAALGQADGTNTAYNAGEVGFPAGVNIWCDLEGVNAVSGSPDVIGYCNAWFDAVAAAGFVPGLYVGANCILDGQQIYDLKFQHYWKSLSRVPDLPARGYQMVQTGVAAPVNGIGIDQDVTQTDLEGGQAVWLIGNGT